MISYSSAQVCELAGISYRQLDYWCRTGMVHPSVQECHGSGTRRRCSAADVMAIKRIRIASELMGGTLQDAIDRLDDLLEELLEDSKARHPSAKLAV